jgi:hypothetical protein
MRLNPRFGLKCLVERGMGEVERGMGEVECDRFLQTYHYALRKSIWGKYALHLDYSSKDVSIAVEKSMVGFLVVLCKVELMVVEDLSR